MARTNVHSRSGYAPGLKLKVKLDDAPIGALIEHLLESVVVDGNWNGAHRNVLNWPLETGQVAKRESLLGAAVRPKVRHDQYSEETRS